MKYRRDSHEEKTSLYAGKQYYSNYVKFKKDRERMLNDVNESVGMNLKWDNIGIQSKLSEDFYKEVQLAGVPVITMRLEPKCTRW